MSSHAPQLVTEYEILGKSKRVVPHVQQEATVKVIIEGKDGKKEEKFSFKSFVTNFGYLISNGFFSEANVGLIKKTSGAVTSSTSRKLMDVTEAAVTAASDSLYGIWLGYTQDTSSAYTLAVPATITDRISNTDFALYRKIPNDGMTPDTNVTYGATSVTMLASGVLRVSRTFTVDRTLGIKVNEVALIGNDGTDKVMICRDFIQNASTGTPYVSVANGEMITIEYLFNIVTGSGYTTRFLQYLQSLLSSAAVTMIKTSGSTASVNATSDTIAFLATATTDTHGILVGGTDAVNEVDVIGYVTSPPRGDGGDYVIGNQLVNSVLTHGATTLIPLEYKDGYTRVGCYRDFTNASATDTQYVTEDALYFLDSTGGTSYYMTNHTAVKNGTLIYQPVLPGETLRIKYYFLFPIGQVAQNFDNVPIGGVIQ